MSLTLFGSMVLASHFDEDHGGGSTYEEKTQPVQIPIIKKYGMLTFYEIWIIKYYQALICFFTLFVAVLVCISTLKIIANKINRLSFSLYRVLAIPIPHPVPVEVPKEIRIPIPQPYKVPIEIPHPYPVEVVKHVEIPIEKPEPVVIEKHVSTLCW